MIVEETLPGRLREGLGPPAKGGERNETAKRQAARFPDSAEVSAGQTPSIHRIASAPRWRQGPGYALPGPKSGSSPMLNIAPIKTQMLWASIFTSTSFTCAAGVRLLTAPLNLALIMAKTVSALLRLW